jgi:hypothetical protein
VKHFTVPQVDINPAAVIGPAALTKVNRLLSLYCKLFAVQRDTPIIAYYCQSATYSGFHHKNKLLFTV